MKQGRIIKFGARGFGFLLDLETRQEHYFHIASVVGRKSLQSGDRVRFKIGERHSACQAAPAIWVELLTSAGGR
jgi:cold shock CspA family protein